MVKVTRDQLKQIIDEVYAYGWNDGHNTEDLYDEAEYDEFVKECYDKLITEDSETTH